MDVRRFGGVLRRVGRALIVAAVLGVAIGYAVSLALPKVYQGESRLLVGQLLQSSNPNINSVDVSNRLATAYATLATTRPVLQAVIDDLSLGTTPAELEKRVRTTASTESPYVTISVEARLPSEAAAVANAIADQLIERSPTLSGGGQTDSFLRSQLDETRAAIEGTENEIASIAALAEPTEAQLARLAVLQDRVTNQRSTYAALLEYLSNASPNALTVVEPAVAPTEASSPKPLLNAALAGMLAVLLVGVLAIAWDQLDDTVKSVKDIETLLGYSPIAVIPRFAGRNRDPIYRLVTVLMPLSSAAEAFRSLRTNLAFSSVDAPIRSLLVTSGVGDEGKSTIAANLAVVLAQEGRSVLLVDADLRRPSLHEMFRLEQSSGLTSLLNFPDGRIDRVAHTTEVSGLRVITSGMIPPNPVELLGSRRMEEVMADLLAAADVVILDTPPTGPVSDAAILSRHVDGVLLIAASRRTRTATLLHSADAVTRASARIIGVVLNAVGPEVGAGYYGYKSQPRGAADVARGVTTIAPADKRNA